MNYMTGTDNSSLIPDLIKNLDKLDNLRKENFFEIFPELQRIKEHG